jgi:FixJ family two-component response regulator
MKKSKPIVFVVDDNPLLLDCMRDILSRNTDFTIKTFVSADEFLGSRIGKVQSCLVLDICMPGLSGLDLQKELLQRKFFIPIIFVTGNGDIPMSVKAMKDGAVDFLPKPFRMEDLLIAVNRAMAVDAKRRRQDSERDKILSCINTLTPREKEVLPWVVTGILNKQIALKLGSAEKTIRVHRGRIMHKMSAHSITELVHLSEKVGIIPAIKV